MNQRTNAGYTIIATITLPDCEFVLGEKQSKTSEPQYVTWYCPQATHYYFGNYMSDKNVALLDLYERAIIELKHHKNELMQKFKGDKEE